MLELLKMFFVGFFVISLIFIIIFSFMFYQYYLITKIIVWAVSVIFLVLACFGIGYLIMDDTSWAGYW